MKNSYKLLALSAIMAIATACTPNPPPKMAEQQSETPVEPVVEEVTPTVGEALTDSLENIRKETLESEKVSSPEEVSKDEVTESNSVPAGPMDSSDEKEELSVNNSITTCKQLVRTITSDVPYRADSFEREAVHTKLDNGNHEVLIGFEALGLKNKRVISLARCVVDENNNLISFTSEPLKVLTK